MEICRGFDNWLECLECPDLCTNSCPIEGTDVIEKLDRHLHDHSLPNDVGREEKA